MPRQKQKFPMGSLSLLLGIALVLLVVVGLAFIFRSMPGRVQTGQVIVSSPIETPGTPVVEILPADDSNVIVLPPVEVSSQWTPTPTWTPYLTWTPRPTPTRRPGPTATPFPLRMPAPDASGSIISIQGGNQEVLGISLGSHAEKLTDAETLHLPLDIDVYEISPSPDSHNLLLMASSFPGGYPFILNIQSGDMFPLIDESTTMSGRFFGWHPDGQQILFWPTIDELWLIDVLSKERTVLSLLNGSVQGAAISPDGQQVAYVTFVETSSQMAQYGIWIVSTAGSDAKPTLNLVGAAYLFGWSPDGKYLLYIGEPDNQGGSLIKHDKASVEINQGTLWISGPDGANARPLSLPYLNGFGYKPVWSSNGKWIASVGLREGEKLGCDSIGQPKWPECQFEGTGIYVENIETGETRFIAPGLEPVWSPDGNYLAFLSLENGSIGIRTVSLTDGETQQLFVYEYPVRDVIWMSNREMKP